MGSGTRGGNTGERLEVLYRAGRFSREEFQELRQAYYFLMQLRLKSQAVRIIDEGLEPQNMIYIEKLTKVEVATLVEVFKVIKNFQLKIKIEFTNSLF